MLSQCLITIFLHSFVINLLVDFQIKSKLSSDYGSTYSFENISTNLKRKFSIFGTEIYISEFIIVKFMSNIFGLVVEKETIEN